MTPTHPTARLHKIANNRGLPQEDRDDLREAASLIESMEARVRNLEHELAQRQRWENRAAASEAQEARLRDAMPNPFKLEMLAEWFDKCHPGDDDEVQRDLRKWAASIRAALSTSPDTETRGCIHCGGTPEHPASDPVNGPRVPCCDPVHREGR